MPSILGKRSRPQRPTARPSIEGDASFVRLNAWRRLCVWVQGRLLYLALLAGLSWLGWHLTTASEFNIERVHVVGNRLIPSAQIVDAASIVGQNIFLVNTRNIGSSVLEIKPIRSVNVFYIWPNAVSLQVIERQPAHIWKVHPILYLVCDEGIVLGETTVENLPVIVVDIEDHPVEVGDTVDREALAAAAYLVTALPEYTDITPHYFEYSRSEGIVLPTRQGYRVAFGRNGDLQQKVLTLQPILDSLVHDARRGQYIDLRIVDHPYFR